MNTLIVLFTAILPVAILVYYICHKDKRSPEPTGLLLKAFFYGILSVPLSLCVSLPLQFLGFYSLEVTNVLGAVSSSFWGAAIPEELAKLFMLWLLLRKNRYFDEKMDGIVYAVCVSMGFAALENIMYLFSNSDSFLTVGVARAIFAVPGHFCFAILMGYYYSLAKFYPLSSKRNRALVFIAPVVVHGLYDSILLVINVTPAISSALLIVFLVFCSKMWKYGSKKIEEHLKRDNMDCI